MKTSKIYYDEFTDLKKMSKFIDEFSEQPGLVDVVVNTMRPRDPKLPLKFGVQFVFDDDHVNVDE